MAKLVQLCLETNHENSDGTAWYAYFDGTPSEEQLTIKWLWEDEREGPRHEDAPLGPCDLGDKPVEVPNNVSRHGGLRRYCVAGAA